MTRLRYLVSEALINAWFTVTGMDVREERNMRLVTPSRIAALGKDGVTTLLLSNMLIIATFAVIYCWQLAKVIYIARRVRIGVPDNATLVVLGMRLKGDRIVPDYRCRLERAYELYSAKKVRKILILGGCSGAGNLSEADCGRELLLSKGVNAQHVVTESTSLNTLENLRNARALLGDQKQENLIMITSRYHLARSELIARGLGMTPLLCGAEQKLALSPRIVGRLLLEAYYVHWYRVGAVWSRLAGWKHSQDRIS